MPINCKAEWDKWERYGNAIRLLTSGQITRNEFISFWHYLQKNAADFNNQVRKNEMDFMGEHE